MVLMDVQNCRLPYKVIRFLLILFQKRRKGIENDFIDVLFCLIFQRHFVGFWLAAIACLLLRLAKNS